LSAAPHSDRAHATWSASATSRNWACKGALALGATVQQLDIESEAAGWGTACHEISEKCLRTGLDADTQIGSTVKTKSHTFEVDEEMAETAQVYVDYVRGRMAKYTTEVGGVANLMIEQRFSLAKLDPPFDAGGTGDAVIHFPAWKLIEVVDLKGGRGMKVEVHENKQCRTYGLGAILENEGLNVEWIMSTIVQPRMQHKDGVVRSETMHVADLMEWTGDLVNAMRASGDAIASLDLVKGQVSREDWGAVNLKQGDHCTFCPAAGICPALEKKALDTANAFFNGDDGKLQIRNEPADLDPDRIRQVLDGADAIGTWLNAVRALGTRLAQQGTTIPGYHLAEKIGNRKFKGDGDPGPALKKLGLTDEDIYTRAQRSPAQLEKVLGAKRLKPIKDDFNALIHRPVTGVSLVSSAKSGKPAVTPAAEKFFA
jgi:hypothetical protein